MDNRWALRSLREGHMREVAIVGAGKIGSMMADWLSHTEDYRVTVIDKSAEQLSRLDSNGTSQRVALDVENPSELARTLEGKFAVLSAAPFYVTGSVAEAAALAGVHYLDLTEDVAVSQKVKALAEGARTAFIPQCGLAPG